MLRILLIDDNQDDRTLIIHHLKHAFPDLQVGEVVESEGFSRALSAGNFDVAVTDYCLLWNDGLTVLHDIKSRYPNCPVIMFTDSGSQEIAVEAMKAGLDDYLTKSSRHYPRLPAVVSAVLRRTEEVLRRKQAEEALRQSEAKYRRILDTAAEGIWLIDESARTTYVNQQMADMLGCTAEEILGRNAFDFVFEEDLAEAERYYEQTQQGLKQQLELRYRRKDGSHLWTFVSTNPVLDDSGQFLGALGMFTDITQRKQVEEQLKASLQEKEVLLKEIHHRVKNNLQIISSLLNLQAEYLKDEQALEIFKDSQNRIGSMALIHEKLYQSNELSQINFADYVQDLVDSLFTSYELSHDTITHEINIDNIYLNVDTAIPCSLILNELISNSLKHAFPPGQQGEICLIGIHSDKENRYTLIVRDNGVGLPPNFDWRNTQSLGLQLVDTLTNQLNATISLDTSMGVEFRMTFSLENQNKELGVRT